MSAALPSVTSSPAGWKRYPMYKDSGVEWLGEIPASWEAKRLKFIAPVSTAKLAEKPVDLPYLGLEHVESRPGACCLTLQLRTWKALLVCLKRVMFCLASCVHI